MRRFVFSLLVLGTGAACVDAREPPAIPKQAEVAYSDKIYLVDLTLGIPPTGEKCTRLGMVMSTTTTATVGVVPGTDGVKNDVGNPKPINASVAHNCFVNVNTAKSPLHVDQIEVTNELFQLCIDSGACEKPDPSKASASQVCSDENKFDTCPVVEVTYGQANAFCKWIGRRLPTGIEHFIMRQGPNVTDPTAIPVYPTGSHDEDMKPTSCSEAVLGEVGCKRPAPMDPPNGKGAAQLDLVSGSKGQMYDLMGNQTEWASDLMPNIRGPGTGLPWFCAGPLRIENANDPPICPTGAICVYGQYQPPGFELGIWPVCIAWGKPLRSISGSYGSLFGGSFADPMIDRGHAGVFGRREERDPINGVAAKDYGFRCVGDVDVANDELEGVVP